jgi:fumarylacetoacetase
MTDHTHNPGAVSWVASAAEAGTDFPLQNLPFGVFARRGTSEAPRAGVAIGDLILDIAACADAGLMTGPALAPARACGEPVLNALMALDRADWTALRHAVFGLLDADAPGADELQDRVAPFLVPQADAEMFLPAKVGGYTDFYASVHHAANVGAMMRSDAPLLPSYKHVPIGYHGRTSSLVVSGTPVRRPWGQTKPDGADAPIFTASRRLDYELEVGVFIGHGNALGVPVSIDAIDDLLFGVCLVNDWSARDVQAWEYQPLGPFLAKNFATTVSPWIVTFDALEPFRVPPRERPDGDPEPLAYLAGGANRLRGAVDLSLDAFIRSAKMRDGGLAPHRVSTSNLQDLYWTLGQIATHHASNGCNLQPGDLLASGTVSGPSRDARGCLLELTWRGRDPLTLPTGEERRFLEDGDEVIFRGTCRRPGAATIGFGECCGLVLPALSPTSRPASAPR